MKLIGDQQRRMLLLAFEDYFPCTDSDFRLQNVLKWLQYIAQYIFYIYIMYTSRIF